MCLEYVDNSEPLQHKPASSTSNSSTSSSTTVKNHTIWSNHLRIVLLNIRSRKTYATLHYALPFAAYRPLWNIGLYHGHIPRPPMMHEHVLVGTASIDKRAVVNKSSSVSIKCIHLWAGCLCPFQCTLCTIVDAWLCCNNSYPNRSVHDRDVR